MAKFAQLETLEMSDCIDRSQRPDTVLREALARIPQLADGEVHVYKLSLAQAPRILACLASMLSVDERDRACRFHFEIHSARFIAGRGFLRLLLGHHLQIEPAKLEFIYGASGKPEINPVAPGRLHFNMAHCEDLALLAISRLGPLGVDLERVRELSDFDELVGNFFSIREATAFARLATREKAQAFFNLWTRKEAWLKATGDGITHGLDKVEVTFLPTVPARLLTLPKPGVPEQWSLCELQPATGFVGAVALRRPTFSATHFDFGVLL